MSSENGNSLRHVALPDGKSATDPVAERHDIVLLFEATKSNPNGDPDADNMPRVQPNTLRGFVTDVCLKRKVRNFFSLYKTDGTLLNGGTEEGYEIFIRENAVLQETMESPSVKEIADRLLQFSTAENASDAEAQSSQEIQGGKGRKKKSSADKQNKEAQERAFRDALCQKFFDVRAFGAVASTEGPLKGSFYGQIRGPVQISFAESLDRILQLDATITRCAAATNKERQELEKQQGDTEADVDAGAGGNRTMGRKRFVDYGLYRAHVYFSPAFAAKTGFSYRDLDSLLFALEHLFADDASAARPGGLRVVGLVDFAHTTALGNAHASKLFETVLVERTPESKGDGTPENKGKLFPESIRDYYGDAPDGPVSLNGNESQTRVRANRIIWEIPFKPDASASAG